MHKELIEFVKGKNWDNYKNTKYASYWAAPKNQARIKIPIVESMVDYNIRLEQAADIVFKFYKTKISIEDKLKILKG